MDVMLLRAGLLAVAVFAIAPSVVHGEPAAPKKTYAQAMAEAQRLVAAKDYHGAAKAYEAATEAKPGDLRATEELAWVSLLAGDFRGAEDAANFAAYAEIAPRLRAMAFYNLGRAAEALGQPRNAMTAYAASLALRDNPEVRARLKPLAPALLAPHRLAGPFARPDAACKTPCTVDRDHWNGDGVAAPFLAAVKLVTDSDQAMGYPLVSIALQLADGWYLLPDIGEAVGGHGGTHSARVRMAGSRLIVDWNAEVGRFSHHDDQAMYVCGLGRGDKPSCVGPIETEQRLFADHCGKDIDCTTPSTYGVWFHCRAELDGDVLEVSRDPSRIELPEPENVTLPLEDSCDALPTFGKHTLTF
jgi:hypothetical protein